MKKTLLVTLILCLVALPGYAHEQTDLDADDSDGPLDTVAARLWDRDFCMDVTHPRSRYCYKEFDLRLVTYEEWDSATTSGPRSFISFEFNLDSDEIIERCLVVRTPAEPDPPADPAAGRPYGTVYRNCTYLDDTFVRDVGRVRRTDEHSVRVRLRMRRLLPRRTRSVAWRSVTSYERRGDQACSPPDPHADGGYGTCTDFSDWRRHRL